MEVRAGHAAAAAGERYGLSGLHLVAGLDADFGKMAVEGSEARAVVYVDAAAREVEIRRERHDAVSRGLDRRARLRAHVRAAVASAEFAVEPAALAVVRREYARHRARERQRRRVSGARAHERGASELRLALYALGLLLRRRGLRRRDGQLFGGVAVRQKLHPVRDALLRSAVRAEDDGELRLSGLRPLHVAAEQRRVDAVGARGERRFAAEPRNLYGRELLSARLDAHEERPPGLDLRGGLHSHVRARASREQSYKRSRGRAAFYKFYHDKRLRYELPIMIVSARAAVKPARYTFPRAFEAASGNII